MKIAEVFFSVQGEINVGKPSVFVRLSGCNLIHDKLGCPWCDTKYAEEGEEKTELEVANEVLKYPCTNIVITGGEPLLQAENVFELVEIIRMNGRFTFEIETNGTLFDFRMLLFDNINCSPKKQSINRDVLRNILYGCFRTRFKFVYESKDDLWWEELVDSLNIRKENVWIMPQGRTREEQLTLSEEVIEYCKRSGFNFTPRLHILVWGAKRAV
jgi:organic radical activating enzyme